MKITIKYDKTSTDRPGIVIVFKDGIELDPAVTSRYYTINGKWFSNPIDDYSWIVPSELIADHLRFPVTAAFRRKAVS